MSSVGPGHDDLVEGHEDGGVVRRGAEVPAAAVRAVVAAAARARARARPAHLRAHHHRAAGRRRARQPHVPAHLTPYITHATSLTERLERIIPIRVHLSTHED